MPTNILMPALSPTMTEGTLARWLKHEGDAIRAGDVIAEIETDKATMEVEAVDEGVLSKILVVDGTQGVRVNDPIGVLTQDGESASAPPAPVRQEAVRQEGGEIASEVQSKAAPAPAPITAPVANGHDSGERLFASPLARRMARQAGVDLAAIKGSGPNGRIVAADMKRRSRDRHRLPRGRRLQLWRYKGWRAHRRHRFQRARRLHRVCRSPRRTRSSRSTMCGK